MPQVIPEKYRDLFQKRAFASLGTLMPDGRPQVTPVWCDFDGAVAYIGPSGNVVGQFSKRGWQCQRPPGH